MRWVALILALTCATALAIAGQQDSRTTQDGVYTTKQADRGKDTYKHACAGCHAIDWYQGDVMKPWEGAPLASLYDVIATSMPQNNPGSLKRQEYVDLLAFILSLNEMPTGADELPVQADALQKIVVKRRSKP